METDKVLHVGRESDRLERYSSEQARRVSSRSLRLKEALSLLTLFAARGGISPPYNRQTRRQQGTIRAEACTRGGGGGGGRRGTRAAGSAGDKEMLKVRRYNHRVLL